MHRLTLKHKPLDPQISQLVADHQHNQEAILEIFQQLQEQQGGIQPWQIEDIARALNVPAERAYGVATFYTLLDVPPKKPNTIRLCDGPPCWLQGAGQIRKAMEAALGDSWRIERSSCLGLCDRAPAALTNGDQAGPLTPEQVPLIPDGRRGEKPDYTSPRPGEVRLLLAHLGKVDPTSLESAREHGAYQALEKALQGPPEAVYQEVEAAKVRGRGGAGFPTGTKWRFVAQEQRKPKYIVCNADESEPLIFKDRVLIESNPHQILEGMALAAYAVGAEEGFIYIRGEYRTQADLLAQAIHQAETAGFLGENIASSGFSFHIHVHRGAGAYICGEETALLESLEGRRGEPRVRPPYPTVSGYHGCPTVVNNVETFSTIPQIILNGAKWYTSIGDPRTPGTKLYTLLGHVKHPGVFEAPYGLTLRQAIEEFGGGMRPNSRFHFALTGGAAGTIVPESLLDIPMDYQSVRQGVSLGAGGILICDETVSPFALLRELLHFFEMESCGKCTPCRVGTRRARELMDRVLAGNSSTEIREQLMQLSEVLEKDSFCGLGQSVAIPMKSAMKHFDMLNP
jgi:NADH:ubiquinone oxidoreductase subunit F (NADH-binding)/NADH:ubiquinone oxidoreductase subunit E